MRIGLLPLARPTFDIPFAEEKLAGMLAALDAAGHETVGPRTLLLDAEASAAALDGLRGEPVDALMVLQVTFTDAAFLMAAAKALPSTPLVIWAPREARVGGRLRLNAFCGLNLASHALGLVGHRFGYLYADPGTNSAADLDALLAGQREATPLPCPAVPPGTSRPLDGLRIARIGAHPEGFDTCRYDEADIATRFGARVDALDLDTLFKAATRQREAPVAALREEAGAAFDGLDTLDPEQLDKSLRLKLALDTIRDRGSYDAFALRCWPESFTEYGGAMCGPAAMLGEARVPCACEADVWGALTQLALQRAADAPVFLVDLVDIDPADDTGIVWHCGQAPASMAAGRPGSTVHTNRRMPLLLEFALKPGRVTLFRLSQSHGQPKAIIASGEMLERPMAFTGTSGAIRFDAPAGTVLERVMASGIEHHMAVVYGDHADALRDMAARMGLPVMDLCAGS